MVRVLPVKRVAPLLSRVRHAPVVRGLVGGGDGGGGPGVPVIGDRRRTKLPWLVFRPRTRLRGGGPTALRALGTRERTVAQVATRRPAEPRSHRFRETSDFPLHQVSLVQEARPESRCRSSFRCRAGQQGCPDSPLTWSGHY